MLMAECVVTHIHSSGILGFILDEESIKGHTYDSRPYEAEGEESLQMESHLVYIVSFRSAKTM